MILELATKANNEKYFKSIRYFSHSLKGDQRRKFISEVGEHNIYLAAQCIMSAETDEGFEMVLIEKAESYAKDYNDPVKSAKGFLALAEFESYEIISKLLLEVKNPSRTHSQVLVKILEGKNQSTFISFVDILVVVQKAPFIHYAINAYNGQLIVNSENKNTLKKLFELLFSNGNFGMARLALEKYNLYDEIQYILDIDPVLLVKTLLTSGKRQVTAIKLAYEICKKHDLFNNYSAEDFIKLILQLRAKSNKGLVFSVQVALDHNIENNPWINDELNKLLKNPHKKVKNKINQLIKKGLYNYLNGNYELLEQVHSYIHSTQTYGGNSPKYPLQVINSGFNEGDNIYPDINDNFLNNIDLGKHITAEEKVKQFFKIKSSTNSIDALIQDLIKFDNASLIEISHLLREFNFLGKIRVVFDYGCYVKTDEFRSNKLLFLHKGQFSKEFVNDYLGNQLKEGDVINFRIIGINRNNYRLNITCL